MSGFNLGAMSLFGFSSKLIEFSSNPLEILSPTGFELNNREREGIVIDTIPSGETGQIQAFASYWTARTQEDLTLFPGDRVVVTGRQGLLLLVKLLNRSNKRRAKIF